MFRCTDYVLFAFQGKPRKSPDAQGYVVHQIETKDSVSSLQLPAYRVQDAGFPLVLRVHEHATDPLRGYIGGCSNFALARQLFTLSNDHWEVATVGTRCIDGERCECTGEILREVGVIREGLVLSAFEPLDDLSSALGFLRRADVQPSVPTSTLNSSTRPPDLPELGGPDIICKLKETYASLFHGDNDYEEELLLQIRAELARDDAVDDAIANIESNQPAAAGARSKRKTSTAKTLKQDLSAATCFEPQSKFLALAQTLAQPHPASRLS